MQPVGGTAKTEFFGDGNKLSKLTQLDHVSSRRFSF
jgi:hypothetical protein